MVLSDAARFAIRYVTEYFNPKGQMGILNYDHEP